MSETGVQALILAAGRGKRMHSRKAKVLHEALGEPLLGHVLRLAEALSRAPVAVVVGHQAESVRAAFGERCRFVNQDPPLGTGHAVQIAAPQLEDGTWLVLNGDMPLLRLATLEALLETHRRHRAAATLLSGRVEAPGAYGRVLRDAAGNVVRIVEARDASDEELAIQEINAGVYAFDSEALRPALLALQPENDQGEYYLTDVVKWLARDERPVRALIAPDSSEILGVNSMAELADASRLLRERRLHELMQAGVAIEDPSSTTVSMGTTVEPDATLRGFTFIEGSSHISAGAVVGPSVRLRNVEIGPGARILDYCVLTDCRVEADARVGPFTHVRPGTSLGRGSKVGNFVELKKAQLGEGAKASHLSYIGDAEIGPEANIGAGTITCNYDGRDKHRTRVGAGAFIGSDTVLVAPVEVGEGAYVGAGSVITRNVPKDALAVARGRQVIKEGWAKRRRAKAKGSS